MEERVARLHQALAQVDQAFIELRFRFDATEADLDADELPEDRISRPSTVLLHALDAHHRGKPAPRQRGKLFELGFRVHTGSLLADEHRSIYLHRMTTTQMRQLGSSGPRVFPIGLGCMGMFDLYGPADDTESIATIHAALDAGITLLDTGDYYAAGHNELLIGRSLRDRRGQAVLSVKFGALRGPDGSWIGMDTRPAAVKNFLGYSLERLGVDYIDIYRPGRLDPNVPIEDTVGAIGELVKAGYVRAIGLSGDLRRGSFRCCRSLAPA
jgi:hypothetical protein